MRLRKRWLGLFGLALFSALSAGHATAAESAYLPTDVREQAVGELRRALREEREFVRVHAAEALLRLSYPEGVREVFDLEAKAHQDQPVYRIGIWRVLAQASPGAEIRERITRQIRDVFLDSTASDQIHAAESLAKLRYQIPESEASAFEAAAGSEDTGLSVFAHWALAPSPDGVHQSAIARLLTADDAVARLRAAYVLRHLPALSDENREKLKEAAGNEPAGTLTYAYLVSASFVVADVCGDEEEVARCRPELYRIVRTGKPAERREACLGLAERGTIDDLALLGEALKDGDPDVRVSAALATLRIERRVHRSISVIDWSVIAAYVLGMIGVGWYCSRRATTTEDYLLGGRAMKPWAVGLSLFATLLSTLSYLAVPGEMINHGPMLASQIVVFPFIILVVGWFLIPWIMKLNVTSAYEILEIRLGVYVRMLGALFFLSMRLMWMSVIIYATTSKVLIPMLGWDESATPYACAVLGAITVMYTSMGGLRAVVITDVVQTFILLGGAALTIVLITVNFGGVTAWWPTQWDPNWDPLKIWFDPGSRITVAATAVSVFAWYVCTAGSDQMAIQRYLATRDVKAARSMFNTSMACNALVLVLLSVLGLALLAYFQTHPEQLGGGQTISESADQLLPRFIVIGLPEGISGLVVAALLAAAMSSLSSGINSSCSVITVDFVDRFRAADSPETDHVRLAKSVSWLVGIVVVALSFGAGMVSGNLLEVTFKIVNLLVSPLFVLFFLAMFVPWANSFGALAAGAASVAVAVGIAFYELLGLSFLWIMPGSFVAGLVVGMVASLVPIGRTNRSQPDE